MAKLTATHAIQARHLQAKKRGELRPTFAAGRTEQATRGAAPVSKVAPPARIDLALPASVPIGYPQPERLRKADGDFITANAPPFTNRIEAPYQRYRANLGDAEVLALDALYDLGAKALSGGYGKLVAGYDPDRISGSRQPSSHLSEAQRGSYARFYDIWDHLDNGLRGVAYDLVFEMTRPDREKPLTVAEVGRALSGYADERRAIGAAVASLRILAWRIIQLMKRKPRLA